MRPTPFLLSLGLALIAAPAAAHSGHGNIGGFVAGLAHPLLGLDHMLAMAAVGLWAAQLGGRALWQVPAAFLGVMAVGAGLAMTGLALPQVEGMILASVLVLGLAVAWAGRLPVSAAVGVAGLFALFHGAAHGQELPAGAGAGFYAAGFLLATTALHAIGLALAAAAPRRFHMASRLIGGLTALGGLALAVS